ncbi:MAG: tRNA (adenosine(37)-N6)-threonylcarbamoyltransferase complex ATPase subunit type 1 TsaE, partial [Clostridia bacterium]|nr:tRNA (adenosine(37)-N6)-threonylcarbamoyltransferase complex ATPase subunit type 1 TsaE [Clostridia bacterium]
FCKNFGEARVKSPTFSIVNEYRFESTSVFHFDTYRITDEEDLYSTGFYEYFSREGYMLCEWSENIPYAIPEDAIILRIEKISADTPDKRIVSIERKTN